MYHSLLKPDLREMLTEQDVRGMAEFCDVLHPAVTAEVLEGFEIAELLQVLDSCPLLKQVEILEYLPLAVQVSIVESLDQTDRKRLSRLLEEMSSDDRVDLLSELSEAQVERLLPLIAQAERNDIRKLLSFPEESAGSVMTTEYASLPESIPVREAIERLRKQAPNRETIYYVYVIDEQRHLLGLVSLRDIILASPHALVSDIMTRDAISVRVDDDQEDVASLLQKFNFIAIPVVDEQNRLVGIVTHDDAMDILEEEATEDAHLAGAVAPLEESYLETSLLTVFRKRGGWLAVLSITAVLIAAILQRLQYISDLYVWMIGFMPLVLSAGGNAGSQSATLVIRMLAVEDSTRHVAVRIAYRELIMGLMLGCFLAAIGLTFAWWFEGVRVGMVIALTMTLVVVNGTVWGAMLPLLFRKMGMDPAMMSNPLIAAISDMMGVLIYFAVALSMLGGTS
ncbi:MAG TPA: magnesium transporter [Planctomycetaceae bacterium]|nr:magnesium transporter [Planctomycetaceae bacterium]